MIEFHTLKNKIHQIEWDGNNDIAIMNFVSGMTTVVDEKRIKIATKRGDVYAELYEIISQDEYGNIQIYSKEIFFKLHK